MTATTQDITPQKLGTEELPPPALLALPIETNTIIYGGTPVFSDANGYAVDGTPASAGLLCWGRCERQINNLNTNTPFGAAASQNVTIRPGAYYFASDGSVTIAQVGKAVYALDNQTCTSTPVQSITAATWLPYLGIVQPPGVGIAGTFLPVNTKVPVYLGFPAPGGIVLHASIAITLAQIQATTSGTAFTISPAMPANARLFEAEVVTTQTFAGGGVTAVTASLSGGTDANGTILGTGATILTAGAINGAVGSNPYQQRGGQVIKMVITNTGGTNATLTAGTLTVDLFYTIAF